MINTNNIQNLIVDFLIDTDLFLVKLTISKDNNIRVFIDGDNGVTIDDCVALSRHIEGNLDRDKEDFELNVSSSGLGQPFSLIRQYENSIGKKVQIIDIENNKTKGVLKKVSEDSIEIQELVSSKNKKNKKESLGELIIFAFESIKETKRIISF